MITYKELNIKAKDIERKTGLQHLDVYRRFMFERILERISVSKYKENFILKGGLLLSAMFGIESRNTRDIDVSIKGIDISKEKMVDILNEILAIDLRDNVKFEVIRVTDIRQDDEYGGNKYHIIGKLENLTIPLEIDISTEDEITPRELKFEYDSLFEDKKIYIDSYNIETILSEKIETVLRRTLYMYLSSEKRTTFSTIKFTYFYYFSKKRFLHIYDLHFLKDLIYELYMLIYLPSLLLTSHL